MMQSYGRPFAGVGSFGNLPSLEVQTARLTHGMCPTCGITTHEKDRTGNLIPISNDGVVLRSRCLLCNPMKKPLASNHSQFMNNNTGGNLSSPMMHQLAHHNKVHNNVGNNNEYNNYSDQTWSNNSSNNNNIRNNNAMNPQQLSFQGAQGSTAIGHIPFPRRGSMSEQAMYHHQQIMGQSLKRVSLGSDANSNFDNRRPSMMSNATPNTHPQMSWEASRSQSIDSVHSNGQNSLLMEFNHQRQKSQDIDQPSNSINSQESPTQLLTKIEEMKQPGPPRINFSSAGLNDNVHNPQAEPQRMISREASQRLNLSPGQNTLPVLHEQNSRQDLYQKNRMSSQSSRHLVSNNSATPAPSGLNNQVNSPSSEPQPQHPNPSRDNAANNPPPQSSQSSPHPPQVKQLSDCNNTIKNNTNLDVKKKNAKNEHASNGESSINSRDERQRLRDIEKATSKKKDNSQDSNKKKSSKNRTNFKSIKSSIRRRQTGVMHVTPTPVKSSEVLKIMLDEQSDKQFQDGWDYLMGDHHLVIHRALGQSLIVKAMHDGSVVAKAFCLFRGWGGLDQELEEAYRILDETNKQKQKQPSTPIQNENGELQLPTKNANALALQAYFCRNGHGCEPDNLEAIRLFGLAAEKRHSWAIAMLAFVYQEDTEVPRDDNKAVRLYQKSAILGYSRAKHNLAELLWEGGVDVKKDQKIAMKWFRDAAKQDYQRSIQRLKDLTEEKEKEKEEEEQTRNPHKDRNNSQKEPEPSRGRKPRRNLFGFQKRDKSSDGSVSSSHSMDASTNGSVGGRDRRRRQNK